MGPQCFKDELANTNHIEFLPVADVVDEAAPCSRVNFLSGSPADNVLCPGPHSPILHVVAPEPRVPGRRHKKLPPIIVPRMGQRLLSPLFKLYLSHFRITSLGLVDVKEEEGAISVVHRHLFLARVSNPCDAEEPWTIAHFRI